MAGTLVMCATPIGNLDDVSPRLAGELKGADVIFAEDTRRTAKLLNHLGIDTPMRSYFAGNERTRNEELGQLLADGARIALVSDAGTPVVSDPGASAVATAIEVGADVTAIAGPSAPVVALSLSGFDGDRFVFDGFLPRKGRKRSEYLSEIGVQTRTTVIFSAPSRIAADLVDLADACGADRPVMIARELTKLHETLYRTTLGEAPALFEDGEHARGEFCVVIRGASQRPPSLDEATTAAAALIDSGSSTSDAVKEIAAAHGVSRRELYERVLSERS
ncbi:MAG: 16S rRNA (cytidine(1402)-2'-O)-methyltransferase [Acidimicrobiia bacterium]